VRLFGSYGLGLTGIPSHEGEGKAMTGCEPELWDAVEDLNNAEKYLITTTTTTVESCALAMICIGGQRAFLRLIQSHDCLTWVHPFIQAVEKKNGMLRHPLG